MVKEKPHQESLLRVAKKEAPEEKQLFGASRIYTERGAYLHRLEHYRNSKHAYDEAYKVAPEDVNLLVKRSAVCVDAMLAQEALADAEAALKIEPKNLGALNCKAQALTCLCEFERSVVLHHRGFLRRRKPTYFSEGIDSGISAIDDAIGKATGQVLLKDMAIIKNNLKLAKDDLEPEKVRRHSRIPYPKIKNIVTQTEAHRHAVLSRVLAFKYFGPMAYDKFFIESLLTDKRIMSANSKGSHDILKLAETGLKRVQLRQDLLREQRPYYSIKNTESSESKHQTIYKKKLLEKERLMSTKTAETWMRQVDACMRFQRVNEMIAKAERMQMFLDSKTSYVLPGKEMFTDRLYATVGLGYLSQYRLSFKISERANRRRIAFLMGMPVGRPSSFDSVLANYPFTFLDPRCSIEKKLEILETCENKMMICWLCYELSKLMCMVKNFCMSKFYAKRCQHQAEELSEAVWWLNGAFAIMSGDMQQGNVNEVRVLADEAIRWANELKDPHNHNVLYFLEKCTEMVGDLQCTDDFKAVVKREKEILNNLDGKLREDAKILFKRISSVPIQRRFSVLPGKTEDKNKSARNRRVQRHLSIVPGPDRGVNCLSRTPLPGLQVFES